jgi:hypothetical protein
MLKPVEESGRHRHERPEKEHEHLTGGERVAEALEANSISDDEGDGGGSNPLPLERAILHRRASRRTRRPDR